MTIELRDIPVKDLPRVDMRYLSPNAIAIGEWPEPRRTS